MNTVFIERLKCEVLFQYYKLLVYNRLSMFSDARIYIGRSWKLWCGQDYSGKIIRAVSALYLLKIVVFWQAETDNTSKPDVDFTKE